MQIIGIPGFSEPFSCWSHFLTAAMAFVFLVQLIYRGRGSVLRVGSLAVYGVCAIYLFSMSGVYHLLEPGGIPRGVFQRLDHSGIWAMIAGTFTPMHIILFRGFWRWGVLLVVWSIAITGLVLEVVFFADFPEWLSLMLYLGLGWVGLLTYYRSNKFYDKRLVKFIFLGGIFYSVGGVAEFLRWPVIVSGVIGPHEVFHIFVMLGAYSHFLFIYKICDWPIKKSLSFLVRQRPENQFIAKAVGENIVCKAQGKENLFQVIKDTISKKYHSRFIPESIRLEYVKEEFINIGFRE